MRRTARYALQGTPGSAVRELWIVLHGYRQLAGPFGRWFRPLDAPHRLLASAEALNRFYVGDEPGRHGPDAKVGGTWMTREARELEIGDYVAWLDRLDAHLRDRLGSAGAPPPRRVALGFSQGAHTASRWAALGAAAPSHLILWGEGLPHDLDEARARDAWRGLTVHLVRGESDRFHAPERVEADADRLEGLGVRVRRWTHPEGHRMHGDTLVRIAEAIESEA